jgi:Protein similar to CwfJ C-terminus 2/Protein similar to CwfJ C-terminus 1
MLSGIKRGKKKQRSGIATDRDQDVPAEDENCRRDSEHPRRPGSSVAAPTRMMNVAPVVTGVRTLATSSANASVADLLRHSLAAAAGTGTEGSVASFAPALPCPAPMSLRGHPSRSMEKDLECRGRIRALPLSDASPHSSTVVVLPRAMVSTKNYNNNTDASAARSEKDMTVAELLAAEKSSSTLSPHELASRNVMRIGKKRKLKLKHNVDSDEEEQQQLDYLKGDNASNADKVAQRLQSRQLAAHDQQSKITAKCWWWLESSRFSRHRLLSLGNHVSLVMAPPELSLTPGQHFYIVPIQHAESWTNCDDSAVWDELVRFQTSLRNMYAAKKQGVLFCETVLPRHSMSFWQTRLEAMVVPWSVAEDAPLYFKSALTAQAEEWGTQQKMLSTRDKGLRRTIPNGFAYFYMEYESNGGYAQMIESRSFPKDFGVDTIAGMLQQDPIRMRRPRETSVEDESRLIVQFLEQYQPFDWTLHLDEAS